MRSILRSTALTLSLLPLVACSSGETKSETTAPAKAEDKPTAPADSADAAAAKPSAVDKKVKVVDGAAPGGDDRYELKIDTPDATSGEESKVTVRVVPKEPWHMNLDFPTSLKVDAPDGVALSKADLKKADAQLDEASCQFDVAFTPSAAGDQNFSGKFKFAVCQDEACSPVTEEIEFKVAVK